MTFTEMWFVKSDKLFSNGHHTICNRFYLLRWLLNTDINLLENELNKRYVLNYEIIVVISAHYYQQIELWYTNKTMWLIERFI